MNELIKSSHVGQYSLKDIEIIKDVAKKFNYTVHVSRTDPEYTVLGQPIQSDKNKLFVTIDSSDLSKFWEEADERIAND
jgi:hypothetical protein